ncbi:tudor domain-containing protein 1 [Elysia marginata]|uniref:Tudor domain-containing protein 1 n=1 Tax=Elysia marginata TaxID=1093978 RepID=A0AAV4JT64_9GAST|nr:tudor domain-containing protein 1 [Elysia marginata]
MAIKFLSEQVTKIKKILSFCSVPLRNRQLVTPAIDDWTAQATRLLKQLTDNGQVQMRIVHPRSKRRRNLSDSPSVSPISPETLSDPNQPSPTGASPPSFFEIPHLVDIISRQGKEAQAISVASALVKAGHAKSVTTESQLETLAKLNAQSLDRRLLGLQQMMHSMKKAKSGLHNQAAVDTTTLITTPSRSGKSQHRRIPACLQTTKMKSKGRTSLLSKLASSEALGRSESLTPALKNMKVTPDKQTHLTGQAVDHANLELPTELSLTLGVEVDKKLRDAGLAVQKQEKSGMVELLKASETDNSKSNSDFDCMGKEENGEFEEDEFDYDVVVTSAISPSSFFVQPVNGHRDLAWLVEGLNKRFGALTDQILLLMSNAYTPVEHTICCAVFSEDGCYYRGLVLDVKSDMVLIFFIDFGDFERVPRNKVYPLSEEFTAIPPLALWCSLKGVMPPETDDTQSKTHSWSVQTVKTFKAFVKKCKLLNIVVSKSAQQRIKCRQTIQSEPLEVFLIDRSETTEGSIEDDQGSDTDQSNEEICLNYELIHLGLAVVQPSPIKRTTVLSKQMNTIRHKSRMEDTSF